MVRVRFKLTEKHNLSWGGTRLVFAPEYDGTIEEQRRFCDATPTGRFEMEVNNDAALDQLHLGEDYYFDITPAKSIKTPLPTEDPKGENSGDATEASEPKKSAGKNGKSK